MSAMIHSRWIGPLSALALVACSTTPPGAGPGTAQEPPPRLLGWNDVRRLAQPAEVAALRYGPHPQQFGELRLPPGVAGPFPVAILVPGACERDGAGLAYLRPLAASLATLGVATWAIEYRREPAEGGGWPNSFRDAASAADHLRVLAQTYPLDLRRVAAVGHATGGQMAMWLAARTHLSAGSPLYMRKPLRVSSVIGLSAITDPETLQRTTKRGCSAALAGLLGGTADEVPERYAQTSPFVRLPLGVPQWLVHGAYDRAVPPDSVLRYSERARSRGDRVVLGVTSNAGHYEPAVPGSSTWMTLQQAVVAALLQ